jgi:hypothetical protein
VPEVGSNDPDVRAQHLYQEFLKRLGLQNVACDSCARALMPAPFNLESYSYSARNGPTWTWDVEFARGLVARRRPAARPIRLTSDDLTEWLERHCEVDRNHLAHIPADRLEEPVLLAPAPDGRGQVLIDGSHRAALRIRAGLPVDAYMLTDTESALAIAITPLTMYAVHQALQERGLLADEH